MILTLSRQKIGKKIDEERYKGAIVQARATKLLDGETPTKRALVLENKYASGNQITEIDHKSTVNNDLVIVQRAFVN